ncbi:conserved hypothetical protein [Trichinella spiralis]|uniref:hypothetical protein n=1 Tax=Trichinella spiralis TaxID=6334 RepID=UPI0001EFEC90|nr:conserved hypothetical protein [Trichinella spiralis]
MLGRFTYKTLSHNFPLLLITAAVCYQVAVTWALDNTEMGKNGLLYDKQNRTETMTRNISNEYLPNENAENNNKTDVKATVFETPTEKENITEFVIKAPLTPITLTPQTTTPIPTNFSEKVEPANNRSKEHTDGILNVVNGSKTYGNDNVSEKLKAGKTNGSGVELIETFLPDSIDDEEFYGNKTVREISTAKRSDIQESFNIFNNNTEKTYTASKWKTMATKYAKVLEKLSGISNISDGNTDGKLNVVNGSKIYGNDTITEIRIGGKPDGSGVELIQTSPSNKNTSTPIPCAPTVSCTDKGLNETFHNSTMCEGYLRGRVILAVSVTLLGMGFIGIIILCIRRFQPMKILRDIIERRRNGENHRNFCISTRAEQEMVSFGEKLNEA